MSTPDLALPLAKEAAIPLELLESLRSGTVLGLVGSGLSIPLGLPTWKGLIEKIYDSVEAAAWRHDEQIYQWVRASQHYEWVAEVLRADQPEAFARAIIEIFGPKHMPPLSVAHALLAVLPLRGYWTTNYDTAIEDYLAVFDRDEPHVLDFEEATTDMHFLRDERRFVLKLHGCVRKRPDKIVLTSSDYFRLMQDERYTRLLALKQAKIPASNSLRGRRQQLRTISVPLITEQVSCLKCCSCHAVLYFLLGRSWCRGGSEHPDSDFVGLPVNTARHLPNGRRSAGRGSTLTVDRSTCGPSARFGTASAQTHSQTS